MVDLPDDGGRLSFDWRGPARSFSMTVNDQNVALQPAGPNRMAAVLPAGVANQPVDRIVLHFEGDPETSNQVVQPPPEQRWAIGATGASLPADDWLVVRSAGEEVGDFAHIFVNGKDVARNDRGYNLVALEGDGKVLDSAVFDTSGDAMASSNLATWIRQWPAGTIIAGAVNDDASLQLSEDALAALHTIGVTADLRDHLRWSHAFIGAKGAPDGSALETTALLQPTTLVVGAPIDATTVYGGLHTLTIQQNP